MVIWLRALALWSTFLGASATCEEQDVRFQGVELSLLRDLKDVAACRAACVQTLACQHFSFTEKQVVSMTKVQQVQQAQQAEQAEAAEQAEQAKQDAAEAAEAAEKETKEEKAEKVQDESDELRAEQKKLFGQLKERRLESGLETIAPSLCLLFDSSSHKESVDPSTKTVSGSVTCPASASRPTLGNVEVQELFKEVDRGSAAPSDVFLQSGPRPTNAWWSNTFINKNLGSPSNFLTQMPYIIGSDKKGVHVMQPFMTSPGMEEFQHGLGVFLGAEGDLTGPSADAWDEACVTLTYRGPSPGQAMTFPSCRGSAYVTAELRGLKPFISSDLPLAANPLENAKRTAAACRVQGGIPASGRDEGMRPAPPSQALEARGTGGDRDRRPRQDCPVSKKDKIMEKRELQKAKRELEDERAQLLQMQDYFNDQQQELEHLRAEVNKSRRAGGLFGCCMAPAIADRAEDPVDPGVTGRPPELYGGPEPP